MKTDTIKPVYPTYQSEWLDKLPGYDAWDGSAELIDLYRLIWESNNYYCLMVPFPNNIVASGAGTGPGNLLNFAAGDTQTGAITAPSYSYLMSIGGYSFNGSTVVPFKFRLYDKGAKADLFYNTYALSDISASSGDADPTLVANYPFGPHFLQSPLIVLPPGILQIEITNLNVSLPATIQMLFSFAVPINTQSTNAVKQGPTK
jgi:hypothetical protein